ncbi:MAG: response regulator [Kofleriaceae bacterium]|nr:response regulator [Kofleriaceae bacterium]MCL4223450.1 response regulator [Myxococcales bacterium]
MTRVLLVDDKDENLYYLSALLGSHGYVVDTARQGAEALLKARQSPPDVVVSDLLMPVMDGYTLLRHWKSDPRLRLAPFVVYTATYTDPADEQLAHNLGADAFILKPAEPDEFLARLRAVEGQVARPPVADPRPRAGEADARLREYNDALIRRLEAKTAQLEEANRALQRDIAQRELTEAALRQAQKMEAVGRLAGGVAHDFNNILSVILTYAELLLEELPADSHLRTELEEIQRAGERATELTRQLLSFSRHQVVQPRVLELSAVIRGMERLLRRLLGEDIELVLRLPVCANVHADPSQIEQIVMNLAVNARDAMPRGGTMTIEVADVELDEAHAARHPGTAPGPHVVLAVRDDGVGIDPAVRERMFEPFFTTKEPGKGTGLGLSTVFGIVRQSGGHLEVESYPGDGATFRVYLPRTTRPPETEPAPGRPAPQPGAETILLVEDDEQVRAMMAAVLRRSGYQVLDARHGAEALAVCERQAAPIALLVTDVVMPGMSGRELAERIQAVRPGLRVLYVSGYTEDAIVQHGVRDAGIAFLHKPITPDALLRKVRQVLDTPR